MVKYYAYGKTGVCISSKEPIEGLAVVEGKGHTVYNLTRKKINHPQSSALTNVYRANIQAELAIEDHAIFLIWKGACTFKIETIEKTITIDTPHSLQDVSYFITNELFGILLWLEGFFLLHGACVVIQNKALVILGESGMGKSTTAAALAKNGASLLSDDLVVINTNEGEIKVIKGLSTSKLWDNSIDGLVLDKTMATPMDEGHNKYYFKFNEAENASYSLGEIVVLSQQNQSSFLNLLAYFPLPNSLLKGEALKTHFEKSSVIMGKADFTTVAPFKNFKQLLTWSQSKTRTNEPRTKRDF